MKLRCNFSFRKPFFAFGLGLLGLLSLGVEAIAQDRIQYRDGKVEDTKILSADGSNVMVQVGGGGSMGKPLATIAAVTMKAPEEVAAMQAAVAAKDYAKALPLAQGLAEKYKGLPTPWARQSASLVGDIQVALGKLKEAEAAYKEYQRLYPAAAGAFSQTDVGMARIAIAQKKYDEAKKKLDPIAEAALKSKAPASGKGAVYNLFSQAFLLLGQIAEAQEQPDVALENYLRTVTLFSDDPASVAAAQEKAKTLREQNPSLTAP